MRIVFKIILNS